jgi:hypothetical protein
MLRVKVVTSNRELAWAAGFFDGEGHVGISTQEEPSGTYRYPILIINQTDRRPLERFQHAVGIGRIYGPYDRKNEKNWKPMFRLQSRITADVLKAMKAIRPLVCEPKAQQIDGILKEFGGHEK